MKDNIENPQLKYKLDFGIKLSNDSNSVTKNVVYNSNKGYIYQVPEWLLCYGKLIHTHNPILLKMQDKDIALSKVLGRLISYGILPNSYNVLKDVCGTRNHELIHDYDKVEDSLTPEGVFEINSEGGVLDTYVGMAGTSKCIVIGQTASIGSYEFRPDVANMSDLNDLQRKVAEHVFEHEITIKGHKLVDDIYFLIERHACDLNNIELRHEIALKQKQKQVIKNDCNPVKLYQRVYFNRRGHRQSYRNK